MHRLMHDKQFALCTRESRKKKTETLGPAQGIKWPGYACQTALWSVTATGVDARDGQDAMTICRSPSRSTRSPGLIL